LNRDLEITGKQLIRGIWSASGEARFDSCCPESGKRLDPRFTEATDEEVDRAVEAAHAAFILSTSIGSEVRASFLDALAQSLHEHSGVLVDRCISETGYGIARAKGELIRTIGQTRHFASILREGSWVEAKIDLSDRQRKPIARPDVRSMLKPLGTVGVIGASNFPFAISVVGTDTVAALASGCGVVVKAHPAHPGTCELLAEIMRRTLQEFDLPPGLFSLVQGRSHRVGERLVNHPSLRALAFTGSEQGGRALCRLAAERDEPIPVFAEMGSVNPVVVLPEAAQCKGDTIADGFLNSLLLAGGQFCTNPGILLVPSTDAGDQLVQRIKTGIEQSPIQTMLHRGISEAYEQGVDQRTAITTSERYQSKQASDAACRAVPAVLVMNACDLKKENLGEIFGPFSILVRWRSLEDLLGVIQKLSGQLTATIHAMDEEWMQWEVLFSELQLKVGRLLMNGFPTGVEPNHAMHHGGPFPAASLPHFTSIGMGSIKRFVRPVCYQDIPNAMLPAELRDENSEGVMRLVDGVLTRESIG